MTSGTLIQMNEIARVCHEVNRAYCQALGDNSQPAWEDEPEWQRQSVLNGVEMLATGDVDPDVSYQKWVEKKLESGWKYGPVLDRKKKENPFLVSFAELPVEQRAKFFIFRAVVHSLRGQGRTDPKVEADRAMLRAALVGLIGVDTVAGLRQMEAALCMLPMSEADKAVSINAIHALLATMPVVAD